MYKMNNTNKKNKITITIKMIPIVVLKQKIQHLIKNNSTNDDDNCNNNIRIKTYHYLFEAFNRDII